MAEASDFYALNARKGDGSTLSMKEYKNKLVLIVNVASKCGYTNQYEGLEALYKKYAEKGLVILGFPCNQFGSQEPGSNEEIQMFCKLNFGVTFPVLAKVDVNGEKTEPIYKWLKTQSKADTSDIKWNFTKFLVGRDGKLIGRYESKVTPIELDTIVGKLL